jgi:hypothetical protein
LKNKDERIQPCYRTDLTSNQSVVIQRINFGSSGI